MKNSIVNNLIENYMGTLSIKNIFVFLALSAISIYGQGNIKGFVTDSLTSEQLKGTRIILNGSSFSTVSNVNGEFSITGISAGDYILQASYLGYKEKKYLVNVKDEGTLKLNIELLPNETFGSNGTLPILASIQAEEYNRQIGSNIIENVIAGKKLQSMPDENLTAALSRLPGVSVFYKPIKFNYVTRKYISSGSNDLSILMPPRDDFFRADNPDSRVLIRGLDSKYANITIDGISILPTSAKDKSVDLNIISERNYDNIELRKTITSDEDAEATAGTINFVTGNAPGKRMLRTELLGNYNRFDKSADEYNFIGYYSERFFNNLLGIQVNANIGKKILSSESQNYIDLFSGLNLSYINEKRSKNGVNILFDINTPDGGSIKFNNIFNKTHSDYLESKTDSVQFFSDIGNLFSYNETEQRIFLSSISGTNYLLGFNIEWIASFSESGTDNPFSYNLDFRMPFVDGPRRGSSFEKFYLENTIESPSKNYCKGKTVSVSVYRKYNLISEITGEIKIGGKYRVDTRLFNEDLYVENGNLNNTSQYRKLADGSLVKKDFSNTRFDGLIGMSKNSVLLPYFQDNTENYRNILDKYVIPLISKDALRLWHQLNYSEYYLNNRADINSYDFSDRISAGYLMHHLNFGHLVKFITGIRLESEQNSFSGYFYNKAITTTNVLYNSIPKKTNSYHYNKVSILPNFQMLLKPADFLNLRMAVYKTLIRPDCYTRIPKVIGLIYGGGSYRGDTQNRIPSNHYLSIGNPDLKNADVWNYELQTQFYGNDAGVFSINAFYKGINGMQQAIYGRELLGKNSVEALGINWNSYPVEFPFRMPMYFYTFAFYNSKKPTRIWGFEIEHQANFRYLPGLLKNIILNYNLTFLRSETWTLDVVDVYTTTNQSLIIDKKQKISDIPEFSANIILGYDIKGFSSRVSYSYRDGDPSPVLNIYPGFQIKKNRFSRLDIALRQRILENISLVLNLNNITNSKEESLLKNLSGTAWSPYQAFRNGFNFDFGVGIEL